MLMLWDDEDHARDLASFNFKILGFMFSYPSDLFINLRFHGLDIRLQTCKARELSDWTRSL